MMIDIQTYTYIMVFYNIVRIVDIKVSWIHVVEHIVGAWVQTRCRGRHRGMHR